MAAVVAVMLVMAVAAMAAYAVGKSSKEPKRFGLAEAKGTVARAKTAVKALDKYLPACDLQARQAVEKVISQTVMSSAVAGGSQVTIGEELAALKAEKDADSARRASEIAANEVEIKRLEAEIEEAKVANEELRLRTENAAKLVAAEAEIAAVFTN